MPGKKLIRWDELTLETILAAHRKLVEMGVKKPSIRMVLYLLMELPNWKKDHYTTLTRKLGQWRDQGTIDFGLFADDGAGEGYRPMTTSEITARIQALRDLIPAVLQPDGWLPAVFVEHISLVDTFAALLDYTIPVVSSQGQLRREHLYSFLKGATGVVEELGGKGIRMIALTDYDKGGVEIYEAHRRWIRRIFGIKMTRWAVTQDQIREAGLALDETHQLDGWMARYGIPRLERELREAVGI